VKELLKAKVATYDVGSCHYLKIQKPLEVGYIPALAAITLCKFYNI
jgi:hypothetical protein